MSVFQLAIYILKFLVPSFFSVLFRAYGLGYKSKKSLAAGLAAYLGYMTVVPAALILILGYGTYTQLSTIVLFVASASVLIFTTDSVGKTIFLQLTQGCLTAVVSVILNLIRTVFGLSYLTLVVMILVVSPLVYCFALRHWAKPLRFIADNMHAEMPIMLALPILTLVVSDLLPVYPRQNFSHYPIFITLLMLAVDCGYLLHIYTFYCSLVKIRRLLQAQARNQLLEAELATYQEYLQAARQNRHDLRHHDAVLLEYLQEGKTDTAIEYLRASGTALEAAALKQFCQNPTANVVLHIYDRKTRAAHISFVVEADISEQLPFTSPEIGALLSNLLENAVEACVKSQEPQPYIALTARQEEGAWHMEMKNTVGGTVLFEGGLPKSTKTGGGTGTRSIAAILEKHHGLLRFQQEKQEFITQVVLPL